VSSVADERVVVRRTFRDADAQAIVDLHERVYRPQYGMDERFLASVADSIEAALAGGWPSSGGAVWLVDGAEGLSGSLALTEEEDGLGRVRWFVFAPVLRGRGLGRALVTEVVSEARAAGLRRLELVTFSALTAAAHLYRSAGFHVLSTREMNEWGPPILFQSYGLDLE
jgi:ribosomal protein S18 acetylase RimI-like enzyme